MKKNQTNRRMFGLAAALMIGSLALSGCTSADDAPAEEPEVQQSQTQEAPSPDENMETLYGAEMPRLYEDMDAFARESTEHRRLVRLALSATQTRENVAYRLNKIWKVADTTSVIESTNAKDRDEFVERAQDMTFKTVEGQCLAETLSEDDLAAFIKSVTSSAQMRFDGDYPSYMAVGVDQYWLHRAYLDQPHDEALAKTDALYAAIEDSGCLVLEGPEARMAPAMVPGWNH